MSMARRAPRHRSRLTPLADELVATKQHYRGFADAALDPWLRAQRGARGDRGCAHTHTCTRDRARRVRTRVRGLRFTADAVGSTEPAHAASTRAWLEARAARFRSTRTILTELGLHPATGAPADGDVARHPVAVIAGRAVAPGDHRHRACARDPCANDRVLAEVPLGRAPEVRFAAETAANARPPRGRATERNWSPRSIPGPACWKLARMH